MGHSGVSSEGFQERSGLPKRPVIQKLIQIRTRARTFGTCPQNKRGPLPFPPEIEPRSIKEPGNVISAGCGSCAREGTSRGRG